MAGQLKNGNKDHDLTAEEARRGGINSGEARRKKATMLSVLERTLDEVPKNPKNPNGLSYREMVTLGLIKGAINGYSKNYALISSLMMEKEAKEETQKVFVSIPAKDMTTSFLEVYRDILDRGHLEYWLEGGRGSIKSSFASLVVIEMIENNPNMCGIALRKVGNTLNDSVFSQLQWAIQQLDETYPGLASDYKITKSPLSITKKSTGQRIYFRGADDPVKIKSIKPPKDMYIGIIWYEEFDQFDGMQSIRKIDQSLMRGGNDFVVLRTYNTPPSLLHFVNKEKIIPKENRLVHRSDYRAVPKKWLGQPFFDEAEYLKSTNEDAYNNEYLGMETGDGSNVFNNIEIREITDEEISQFDYVYMGLDFGWYPDPLAWTKSYFNPSNRTLYIYDEFVVNKMSNAEVWEHLKEEKGVEEGDLIIADSAEPKSIGDFRSYGSAMRGAEKGPESVKYSMKWLQSLSKIVIDPKRTPSSLEEFTTYEYEKDKDGNVISAYPDANNHCIDSVRYALNNIWKKRGQ